MKKKIILFSFVFLSILSGFVFVKNYLLKSVVTYNIEQKVYTVPEILEVDPTIGREEFVNDKGIYSCIVDAYNKANPDLTTPKTYNDYLSDEQLNTIKEFNCSGVKHLKGIGLLHNVESGIVNGQSILLEFEGRPSDRHINHLEFGNHLGLYPCVVETYNKMNNTNYDYKNAILSNEQLAEIKELTCYNSGDDGRGDILHGFGLYLLPNLETLTLMNAKISETSTFDLSVLTNLKTLNLGYDPKQYTPFPDINISAEDFNVDSNINLTNLTIIDAFLPNNFNINSNINLTEFVYRDPIVYENNDNYSNEFIKNMDFSNLNKLKKLNLSFPYRIDIELENVFEDYSLDLTGASSLEELRVYIPKIRNLDLTNNINLEKMELIIGTGDIEGLNLKNNVNLDYIDVNDPKGIMTDIEINSRPSYLTLNLPKLNNFSFEDASNLKTFHLVTDYLNSVDLTGAEFLTDLYIKGASFKEVNLTNNKSLVELSIDSYLPLLEKLNLSGAEKLENLYYTRKNLNEIIFKDNFELKKITLFHNKLKEFNANNHLPNLQELDLSDNLLETVNLENAFNLTEIDLSYNRLKLINLRGVEKLENFEIGSGLLEEFYLKDNIGLKSLILKNNKLKHIDFTEAPNLENADLSSNNLETIDLNKNSKLESLNLYFNNLKEINLKNNINLKNINLEDNFVENIDLSTLTKLEELNLIDNKLENITFGQHDNLTKLKLALNNLTTLDTQGIPNVELLSLSSNEIKNIDISNMKNLRILGLEGNDLFYLNTSKNENLDYLDVSYNNINALDLSKNNNITTLGVSYTGIDNIYINSGQTFDFEGEDYSDALTIIDNDSIYMNVLSGNNKIHEGSTYNLNLLAINVPDGTKPEIQVFYKPFNGDPVDITDVSTIEIGSIKDNFAEIKIKSVPLQASYLIISFPEYNISKRQNFTVERIYIEQISYKYDNKQILIGNDYSLDIDIEPINATNKTLKIVSENEDVVIVKEGGTIQGLKEGKTNLNISTTDGSRKSIILPVTVKSKGIVSETYEIKNNLISKIPDKLKFPVFSQQLLKSNESLDLKIMIGNEEMNYDEEYISSGSILNVYDNNEIIESYKLIIPGDVSGDGEILANDILNITLHILEKTLLEDVKYESGDINGDGKVNASDIMYLRLYILGKYKTVWGN